MATPTRFSPLTHGPTAPFTAGEAGGVRSAWGTALAAALILLSSSAPALAQIRMTAEWDANTDGVTVGYMVSVGTAPGSYLVDIDAGSGTSVALDLPTGQVYYIIVRAYNALRQRGPASNEVVVNLSSTPAAPTGLQATVNGTLATLSWGPPSNGVVPTQYLLTVGTTPGGADVLNDFPVGLVTSVSGHLPVGRYYARLRAANALGAGPYTPEVTLQVNGIGPLGPTALSVSWQGTVATFSWHPPASATPSEIPSSYVLEAGRASGTSEVASANVGNVTSYTTDVPPGTYYVRVRGVNAHGISGPSNEVVVQGRGGPGRPTALSSSGSGSDVRLIWNAPSGAPPTGYIIEAGSGPGLSDLAVLPVGPQTTFSTTGVPPGTYYVRVRAVNQRGAGDPSNEIIVRR